MDEVKMLKMLLSFFIPAETIQELGFAACCKNLVGFRVCSDLWLQTNVHTDKDKSCTINTDSLSLTQ